MPSESPELRFAVLCHEGVLDPHFDLMFEIEPGGNLATWRSPRWPIDCPTELRQLGAHRPDYLQYEGEISGGRGSVRRIAEGTYRRFETASRWSVRFVAPSGLAPIVMDRIAPSQWRATTVL